MKKILNLLMIALTAVVLQSCGSPKKMAEKADLVTVTCTPEVLEVVAGNIKATLAVTFPKDFFHPKAIVEVVPTIIYNGGESVGSPIMLQGEKVTENYTVIPKAGGIMRKELNFKYKEGMERSRLELKMTVLYKDKRIPFAETYKIADGANTTYMLVKTKGSLAYAPDNYQAIITEHNEAQILYLINSANVRSSQLKSDDIKTFQELLKNIKADERRELVNTDIIAYASPDGKEDFNAKLSEKRAKTATDAFNKKINDKKVNVETTVNTKSIEEDWEGFKDLVTKSEIADKDLILRVLEMYSDPAVREREIKNMSQVYTILKKGILPSLRRARFIANIEFTNYSSEELLSLVNDNIEILDEEALLHVATLIEDNDLKVSIYKKAINKYSSDRGKINLAVTYLMMGKNDEAASALANVAHKDEYYYNTLGVIDLRKGNNAEAVASFEKSSIKEAEYNIAVVDILNGNYEAALHKLNGEGSLNEALANVLVGNLNAASNILKNATCACRNYLKAIIAARKGNVNDVKKALEIALKEEKLAKRYRTDIEFAKIR